MNTVVYADGPVFSRQCPTCRRFIKAPERVTYLTNLWSGDVDIPHAIGECARCGSVRTERVGWAEDYRNDREEVAA